MATFDSDDLSHYGVKGMKWGVKKSGDISSNSATMSKLRRKEEDTVKVRQKPGQFVKATGGKRQTADNDAVKVAASRQRAKKSTTDSLSTKQLQAAVDRMQLEQRFHELSKKSDRRNRGRKIVDKMRGVKLKEVDAKIRKYDGVLSKAMTAVKVARKASTGV